MTGSLVASLSCSLYDPCKGPQPPLMMFWVKSLHLKVPSLLSQSSDLTAAAELGSPHGLTHFMLEQCVGFSAPTGRAPGLSERLPMNHGALCLRLSQSLLAKDKSNYKGQSPLSQRQPCDFSGSRCGFASLDSSPRHHWNSFQLHKTCRDRFTKETVSDPEASVEALGCSWVEPGTMVEGAGWVGTETSSIS